ncbi:MAG: hypothetical protein VKP62_02770 [Candidatus Sericytochromatia bacterium]|nr:hypothetical protein [Candidatus Sericytochromatia bacterium]
MALPPDPYDPEVARRNRRLGLAIFGVVLFVMYLTYLQRAALFHTLFKVG